MADSPKKKAAWELIQAKTFLKWCNMYLKRKNFPAIDVPINEAFENGIKLMQLVNALYDVPMPKKYKKAKQCKLRPIKLDNVNIAMEMLEKKAEVKTNYLKNVNLLDKDWKMVLGMIWAIILDFNIKGIGEDNKNAKEGLLIWCRKKTKGYKGVDGKINNFSTDWKSGKAFAALVNRHYPDLMEYNDKASPEELMEEAFHVCDEHLGIERLLDVEDLTTVPKPDEKSVMTYVSEMYKVFSKTNMKEQSAKHIKDFLAFVRNIKRLQSEYEDRATKWMAGCEQQTKEFEEHKEADNISKATEVLNAYKTYVTDTQPQMIREKIELEELYTNIQSQLKVNKRVTYETEISPDKLDSTYDALNAAQQAHYEKSRKARFKFVEAMQPTGVSPEQLKEWEEAFEHFDENKNDYLEFDEFSAALKAVGVPMTEETERKKFNELAVTGEDDVTKCVTRDKFLGFLENMYTADDTPESVIGSMDMLGSAAKVKLADLMTPPLDDEDREFIENNVEKNKDGTFNFASFTKSQFA